MQVERDRLSRRLIPGVSRLIGAVGPHPVEIDLRWGITEAEAQRGEVLPLCLRAIDRCRPYFLCMLGARYGWRPDDGPDRMKQIRPDLNEPFKRLSATEFEIAHALLEPPAQSPPMLRLLLFRSERLSRELGGAQWRDPDSGDSDALAELKDVLRERFPESVVEYDDLETFDAAVVKFLNDAAVHARAQVEQHRSSRSEIMIRQKAAELVDRTSAQRKLAWQLQWTRRPVVVSGIKGCGASTLLADWALKIARDRHSTVHYRDCESSGGFTNWRALAADLSRDIEPVPGETALPSGSADVVARMLAGGTPCVMLDNLDGLFDGPEDFAVDWLPSRVPRGTKLIVSVRSPALVDMFKRHGWKSVTVGEVPKRARRAYLETLLLQHSKRLEGSILDQLATAPSANTPFGMRLLVDRLRVDARHESLSEEVGRLRLSPGPEAILDGTFEQLLANAQGANQISGTDFVQYILSPLLVSRRGISLHEFHQIGAERSPPLAPLGIAAALSAAAPLLVERGAGLIELRNEANRVGHTRIVPADILTWARRTVANILLASPTERRIQERPWQLVALADWPMLAAELAEPDVFVALWQRSPVETVQYFERLLEGDSNMRISTALPPISSLLELPEEQVSPALQGAMVLYDRFGEPAESLKLAERLQQPDMPRALRYAAYIRVAVKHLAEGSAETAAHVLSDPFIVECAGIDAAMGLTTDALVADALLQLGKARESFALQQKIEHTSLGISDDRRAAIACGEQGKLLLDEQRVKPAKEAFSRQLSLATRAADAASVAQAHQGLATCSWQLGRPQKAVRAVRRAIARGNRSGAFSVVASGHLLLAGWLTDLDNFDGALEELDEARAVADKLNDPGIELRADLRKAQVFARIGRPEAAAKIVRRTLKRARQVAGAREIEVAAGQMLTALNGRGTLRV